MIDLNPLIFRLFHCLRTHEIEGQFHFLSDYTVNFFWMLMSSAYTSVFVNSINNLGLPC